MKYKYIQYQVVTGAQDLPEEDLNQWKDIEDIEDIWKARKVEVYLHWKEKNDHQGNFM